MARRLARASSVSLQRLAVMGLGALQQCFQRGIVQPAQHQHLGAGQQRAVQLEGRVLGGGADQHHGAVFHHRQEAILLAAVEAVDLVDEQQRALPRACGAARAASKVFLRSATPENTADNCSKCRLKAVESSRAMVVLPVPGGPHRMIEMRPALPRPCGRADLPAPADDPARPPRPGVLGRSRSARGRGASSARSLASKRSLMQRPYSKKGSASVARGAFSSARLRAIQMPLHTERQIVGLVLPTWVRPPAFTSWAF